MEHMSYIIFICTAAPLLLMLIPIEKHSRKVILFMLIGMFCCLFVSEVNGLLLRVSDFDILYFTTNITPITEEIVKALPVLLYAVFYTSVRKNLLTASFSVGVGFAMLENLLILTQNFRTVDLWFAAMRGFGSGLMHSICTIMVGYFIVFVRKQRKIFICGTVTALIFAVVYHAVFNLLVQAGSVVARDAGLLMPFITYLLVNFRVFSVWKARREKEAAGMREHEK